MPSVRFEVRVVPRSKNAGPAGRRNGQLVLRVTAPPDAGRANAEVERVLTRMLGARATIVRGHSSRLKLVEAALGRSELDAILQKTFPSTAR